tara:strand:- start:1748 stop:2182 length:435 start_codon:yes stop_codon:yes gene_type:complete
MRVKISYSTDIEELPKEISDLLERSVDAMHDQLTETESLGYEFAEEEDKAYQLARSVDSLRKYLAKFDIRLQEVESLLMGYLTATNSQEEPQTQPQPQPQTQPQPQPRQSPEQIRRALDNVQEQAQQIKKEMPRVMSSLGNEKG